jgi:hypothetical protein
VLAVVVQVQGPNRGVDLALKELDSLSVPYLDFSIDLGLSDSSLKGRQLANSVEQFRCSIIHSVQHYHWIWRKIKVPLCVKPGFRLFFIGDAKIFRSRLMWRKAWFGEIGRGIDEIDPAEKSQLVYSSPRHAGVKICTTCNRQKV